MKFLKPLLYLLYFLPSITFAFGSLLVGMPEILDALGDILATAAEIVFFLFSVVLISFTLYKGKEKQSKFIVAIFIMLLILLALILITLVVLSVLL